MGSRGTGGTFRIMAESFYDDVYRMVRRIPRGRVTTYGHVAALCGKPRAARTVGWALHALPEGTRVPWHRVINAHGGISISKVGIPAELQRALLEAEGVEFDLRGNVGGDVREGIALTRDVLA